MDDVNHPAEKTPAGVTLAKPEGKHYNNSRGGGLRWFNIGFAELLLVLIIAYVIVGPKDLPIVARWLGRMVRTARQLIRELKAEVGWDEMMAETSDIRQEINSTMKEADLSSDLKEARQLLQKNIKEAEKETMQKPENGGNGK